MPEDASQASNPLLTQQRFVFDGANGARKGRQEKVLSPQDKGSRGIARSALYRISPFSGGQQRLNHPPRSSTGTRLKAGVPLSGSLWGRISTLASG